MLNPKLPWNNQGRKYPTHVFKATATNRKKRTERKSWIRKCISKYENWNEIENTRRVETGETRDVKKRWFYISRKKKESNEIPAGVFLVPKRKLMLIVLGKMQRGGVTSGTVSNLSFSSRQQRLQFLCAIVQKVD